MQGGVAVFVDCVNSGAAVEELNHNLSFAVPTGCGGEKNKQRVRTAEERGRERGREEEGG